MGWWNQAANGTSLQPEPTGLVWGDMPADAFDRVLRGDDMDKDRVSERLQHELLYIREEFRRDLDRLPTKQEMVAGLLFSLPDLREFIATQPDGPAPAAMQTFPGMLNVGPVTDAEVEGMRRFMEEDDGENV